MIDGQISGSYIMVKDITALKTARRNKIFSIP